jgi:cyclase
MKGKADAVLGASIFHFGTYTVGDVKQFLKEKNIPVRLA